MPISVAVATPRSAIAGARTVASSAIPRSHSTALTASPMIARMRIVGGGKPALPGKVRARLELADERRFASGVVHLRYRVIG